MPSDNRISAEIAPLAKTQILTKINEIQALLPFVVNLTPAERKRIPDIGTERSGMVAAFIAAMTAHPELVPSYVDMAELARDQTLRDDLLEIYLALLELTESVGDTLKLAGADMYVAFLSFYANVQQAAKRNVPGADTIYNDLKRFFPRGRPATPAPAGPGA
jgi:hypothetical protein